MSRKTRKNKKMVGGSPIEPKQRWWPFTRKQQYATKENGKESFKNIITKHLREGLFGKDLESHKITKQPVKYDFKVNFVNEHTTNSEQTTMSLIAYIDQLTINNFTEATTFVNDCFKHIINECQTYGKEKGHIYNIALDNIQMRQMNKSPTIFIDILTNERIKCPKYRVLFNNDSCKSKYWHVSYVLFLFNMLSTFTFKPIETNIDTFIKLSGDNTSNAGVEFKRNYISSVLWFNSFASIFQFFKKTKYALTYIEELYEWNHTDNNFKTIIDDNAFYEYIEAFKDNSNSCLISEYFIAVENALELKINYNKYKNRPSDKKVTFGDDIIHVIIDNIEPSTMSDQIKFEDNPLCVKTVPSKVPGKDPAEPFTYRALKGPSILSRRGDRLKIQQQRPAKTITLNQLLNKPSSSNRSRKQTPKPNMQTERYTLSIGKPSATSKSATSRI